MAEPRINTGTPLESVVSGISDPGMRSIIGKMDSSEREGRELARKSVEKMEAEPKPLPPALAPAPDLKDYQRSPMESFGSAAGFMATFGSLLTRRPLTNALNAAASVMDAANKQDAAAFGKAFDKWKVETENSWKTANWEMDQYKEALGKDEKEAEIFAKSIKNDTAIAAIQARMGEQYHRDMMKQIENSKKPAEIIFQKVEDGLKEESEKREAAGAPPMTKEEFDSKKFELFKKAQNDFKEKDDGLSDAEYEKFKLSPESAVLADAYADGVPPPELVRGLGRGAGDKLTAIQRFAKERHPDLKIAQAQLEYGERKRELGALATRSAPAKIAVKEMDKLGKPMIDAIKKLDPTQFPDLNSLRNAYDKKTGGPDVVKAALAVQEFKTAFVNLMVRNGVATDQARGKADELMDKNFSLSQVNGVVDQAKISGAAVIDALTEVRDELTGKSSDAGKSSRPTIKTKEEFDSLKSGDEYFEEGDTTPYRKP